MKWLLIWLFSIQICFAEVPEIHLRPPSQVAASAINQNVQIVFFMVFFSAVQSVVRHLTISGHTVKTVSRDHLKLIIADSIESVINDPSLWIGVSTSLASAFVLAEPARAGLEWAFKNKAGKSLMRQFLLSAVPVAITAYTWEFFRQLWTEARSLCSTSECFARTNNLLPLIDSISHHHENVEAQKSFAALQEQLKNMGFILLKSPELRNRMMSNIFQTHGTINDLTIASAALLLGSYITLRLGPFLKGYTSLAANGAGLVLGVVTAFIIEFDLEQKVFNLRSDSAEKSLSICTENAKSILLFNDPLHDQSEKLIDALEDCQSRREEISTAQLRLTFNQYRQLKDYAKEIKMHPEQDKRILPLVFGLQSEMTYTLKEALDVYQDQQIMFKKFLKFRLQKKLRSVLQCEIEQLKSTQTFFLDQLMPLFKAFPALDVEDDPTGEWHRSQYYLSGISENKAAHFGGVQSLRECVSHLNMAQHPVKFY